MEHIIADERPLPKIGKSISKNPFKPPIITTIGLFSNNVKISYYTQNNPFKPPIITTIGLFSNNVKISYYKQKIQMITLIQI